MKIVSRWNHDKVIYEDEAGSMRGTVEHAVKDGANLDGAAWLGSVVCWARPQRQKRLHADARNLSYRINFGESSRRDLACRRINDAFDSHALFDPVPKAQQQEMFND